jgi:surface protein
MNSMFSNTSFNKNIGQWNTANVTDMYQMFKDSPFNQDIGDWNTGSVEQMGLMFSGATNFNQDLSSWNVSSVLNMNEMLENTSLSSDNYDSLLIGWASQNLQQDVVLGVEPTKYCSGATARNTLVNTYGWTITDGGYDTTCRTAITDANFQDAINTCLTTNPADGLCASSEYGSMPTWDVSQVTNMNTAFNDKVAFNADISSWDVSNVTTMNGMFNNLLSIKILVIGTLSNVTDIDLCFQTHHLTKISVIGIRVVLPICKIYLVIIVFSIKILVVGIRVM